MPFDSVRGVMGACLRSRSRERVGGGLLQSGGAGRACYCWCPTNGRHAPGLSLADRAALGRRHAVRADRASVPALAQAHQFAKINFKAFNFSLREMIA